MRLLHTRDFTFKVFHQNLKPYAILSHRWTEFETTIADVETGRVHSSTASNKVSAFAQYVKSHVSHLEWIWVDTCCIKQDNAVELSESINSMFDWYRHASVCIAYLHDVEHPSDRVALRKSVWFKRGWTLQELLASTVVIFLTKHWHVIGHKGDAAHLKSKTDVGPNIEPFLAEVTGIPQAVLQDFSASHTLSLEARMRWMGGRETLKEEDMYYAMFGIFGVTPGANYGEKKAGAEQRLFQALESKERLKAGYTPGVATQQSSSAIHIIPFPRDPTFIVREETSDLWRKLSKPGSRVALVGLGGIGKTQLASEHCHRLMDESRSTWILWIHASSAARFDQEVQSLASDLNIAGREEKTTDILQLFRAWLLDTSRKWLIVLDNADEAEFLFQAQDPESATYARTRIDHIPVCSHGSVLVTTRRRGIAGRLVDRQHTITLQPDKEHAVRLLNGKLGSPKLTADMERLAAALEYMPLAVTQAAAYIQKSGPRCTIADYMLKLEKSERSKTSLLSNSTKELRRDLEAKDSILLTWQISFEHIVTSRRSAADLLSLMSFFDNQGIPDFLVDSSHPEGRSGQDADSREAEASSSEDESDTSFEDDLNTLRDYDFISVMSDRSTLQMHRLVQLAAQLWLKGKNQHAQFEVQSLRRLDDLHPEPEYREWQRCKFLYPHVALASKSKIKENNGLRALDTILYKASWFAREQGAYTDAEKMAKQSLSISTSICGENDPSTLASMANLASTFWNQGRWSEAEELQVKVMETSRTVLGAEHPSTLRSMANLASTFWNQGRWSEAEELQVKVMETSRTVLGAEHPDTLASMHNLASTYRNQGRWSEAEELEVKVMEARRTVLGAEHPSTLASMANLASTFWNQGRWSEAEELQVKVMETSRTVLGAEHPSTLRSMANLASTFWNQGRWSEAEELQVKVMETSRTVLGAEHPSTLTSMANLASTFWNQGRWSEAEELQVKVMETSRTVLGAEHPDTLASMHNLASTYRNQGRWSEAEELEVKVMEARRTVLGAEHPSTLASMANLASTFWNQGRWSEAEELEVKVMEARRTVLGAEHPSTLTSMHNLASTFWNQGRWSEAEELQVKVMETSRTVLGAEHPDRLTSMANLASTFWNQGRWSEAEELEVKVMEARRTVLGAEHPSTLTSMHNLASTYRDQGRWSEAEELQVKVMETRRTVLGAEHPDTLTSMHNLAVTYHDQGHTQQAEELKALCFQAQMRVLGASHPDTQETQARLQSFQSLLAEMTSGGQREAGRDRTE